MNVTNAPQNVTVMVVDGGISVAVANADVFLGQAPGVWWLARLKVEAGQRGKGLGSRLLQKLLHTLAERTDFTTLVVAPGGYGSSEKDLKRFYAKHGFVQVHDPEGLVMEWRAERSADQNLRS